MPKESRKYEIHLDPVDEDLMEAEARAEGLTLEQYLSACIERGIMRRLATLRESISAEERKSRH